MFLTVSPVVPALNRFEHRIECLRVRAHGREARDQGGLRDALLNVDQHECGVARLEGNWIRIDCRSEASVVGLDERILYFGGGSEAPR